MEVVIPPEFAHRTALSRGEVARTLGKSEKFVDGKIADGTLRAWRMGRTVFVVASDVWGLPDRPREASDRGRILYREMA